jgi:hypothetical protein
MEFVYNLFVVLHFLGLASLIGGWLVQMRSPGERFINMAMLHGVIVQLVTGLILVGLAEGVDSLDRDIDNAKIGVKLVVLLIIGGLAWVNRKRQIVPDGLYLLVGALSIANVVIAVYWQ